MTILLVVLGFMVLANFSSSLSDRLSSAPKWVARADDLSSPFSSLQGFAFFEWLWRGQIRVNAGSLRVIREDGRRSRSLKRQWNLLRDLISADSLIPSA